MKLIVLPPLLAMLACATGENLSQSSVRGLKTNTGRRNSKGGSRKGGSKKGSAVEGVLDGVIGAVFTSTNAAPPLDENEPLGNELVMYHQLSDGSLKGPVGRYQTGGTGTSSVTSQNSVIVSGNQVFVANGSNSPTNAAPEGRTSGSVSRFVFNEFGALLISEIPSGGENPVALALCGKILYVANAALINGLRATVGFNPPHPDFNSSITALYVEEDGSLTPLPDLTQDIGPFRVVDIVLSPDNRNLVVAASIASLVLSFELDDKCMLTGTFTGSDGEDTQGSLPVALSTLELGGKNYVYSSNAGDGTVAAFRIESGNRLEFVNIATGAGPDALVCWTLIVDGKYLYTTNTFVSSVSSFEIDQDDGSVKLLELVAAESFREGGRSRAPADMYGDGNLLYVLFAGTGEIDVYHVEADGKLTLEQTIGGMPEPNGRFPAGLAVGKFHH